MEPKCTINCRRPEFVPGSSQLPESPRVPMEFLSRSWSASALEVSKVLAPQPPVIPPSMNGGATTSSSSIPEETAGCCESEELPLILSSSSSSTTVSMSNKNHQLFSFASSATSRLVLDRIMSQSARDQEVSPLTSGRLSHSSEPLNGTDSPPMPISPSDQFDDLVKFFGANNSIHPVFNGGRASGAIGSGTACSGPPKTVGRWLKDRREKKKEENRAHNAQLHATIKVAAVAAAVAAIAAATAASLSAPSKDERMAKTDMAVASAATLVAAQCVEAAEAMGAERDHLASVVSSAVNVRSHDDITTLTAAAATALRGAAILKARALKEVWNVAAVTPLERGIGGGINGICGKGTTTTNNSNNTSTDSGEILNGENFLGVSSQELLSKGSELLKRTRQGDLHWKIVSVYIHRTGQVMLKMSSKHVVGTITKKKKNVVLDVCTDLPAWPGRHLFDDGEKRRYFGLKTDGRGIVEFECRNQREYDIWTQGVSRLLSIVAQRQNRLGN